MGLYLVIRNSGICLYRDVRKDMINYCEESGESSSTDEEDLCKPRVTLRRRDNKVNYNENALATGESETKENTAEPKPKYVIGY